MSGRGGKRRDSNGGRKLSQTVMGGLMPRLVQLEGLEVFNTTNILTIHVLDEQQVESALGAFKMGGVGFRPITLGAYNEQKEKLIQIKLTTEEFMVSDCFGRKLFSFALEPAMSNTFGGPIAKIKHPSSGIKLYSFVRMQDNQPHRIQVYKIQNDREQGRPVLTIERDACGLIWMLLNGCGCAFTKEAFVASRQDLPLSTIRPRLCTSATDYCIQFQDKASQQERMVSFAFGLYQMARVTYPELLVIMQGQLKKGYGSSK